MRISRRYQQASTQLHQVPNRSRLSANKPKTAHNRAPRSFITRPPELLQSNAATTAPTMTALELYPITQNPRQHNCHIRLHHSINACTEFCAHRALQLLAFDSSHNLLVLSPGRSSPDRGSDARLSKASNTNTTAKNTRASKNFEYIG